MSKKYKVVVSNTVLVPVTGSISNEAGEPVKFKFSLTCKRLAADEMKTRMEGKGTLKDILQEVTTGWSGQRLVLEESGDPAEFCPEALEALLDISGMSLVCFNAYGAASAAKEKN